MNITKVTTVTKLLEKFKKDQIWPLGDIHNFKPHLLSLVLMYSQTCVTSPGLAKQPTNIHLYICTYTLI